MPQYFIILYSFVHSFTNNYLMRKYLLKTLLGSVDAEMTKVIFS